MSRATLLGLLAAGACALAGCGLTGGGQADEPPARLDVPDGWIAFEGRGYAFARPREFAALPAPERPEGEQLLGFEGAAAAGGGLPSQVGVGVQDEVRDDLAAAVRLAAQEGEVAYPGYRILRRSTPAVAGGRAVRIDAEYDSFGANPVKVRTVDLWVQTDAGRRLNLFARGPAQDYDRLGLARAVDTFRLR